LPAPQPVAGDSQPDGDEEQDHAQSEEECIHVLKSHALWIEDGMGWMDSRNQRVKSV